MRIVLTLVIAALESCSLVTTAAARDFQLTIYDDGISCPGNCDAHVVLHPTDNGTRYAFRPNSSRSAPQKCVASQECKICFGEADASCMVALYRGGGPPAGTFDFTPAFYREQCSRSDIPQALKSQCSALQQSAQELEYSKRVNCFRDASDPLCTTQMANAAAAQAADAPKRAQCIAMGQAAFNAAQSDPGARRALDCNYSEQSLGGPNARGTRWRLLLPGACRAGTYVGRDGLDCCSDDVWFAAANHRECSVFFPRRPD